MNRIISFLITLFAMFVFTSCVQDGISVSGLKKSELKKGYGYIVTRIKSNYKKEWQYVYYNRVDKSAFQKFIESDSARFIYKGDSSLQIASAPAGEYYWSGYYLFSKGTSMDKSKRFVVYPNKINYVGDINIEVLPRRYIFRMDIVNNSFKAKEELAQKAPKLFRNYTFVTTIKE